MFVIILLIKISLQSSWQKLENCVKREWARTKWCHQRVRNGMKNCAEFDNTQKNDMLQLDRNAFTILSMEGGNAQIKFKCLPDTIDEIDKIIFADSSESKVEKCKEILRFLIKTSTYAYEKSKSREKSEQAVNNWLCPRPRSQIIPDHYNFIDFSRVGKNFSVAQTSRDVYLGHYQFRLRDIYGKLVDLRSKYYYEHGRTISVYPYFCICQSAHWKFLAEKSNKSSK